MKLNHTIISILTSMILFHSASTHAESQSSYQSFIPKNWKVLSKAQGDLNGDRQADLALIIENTNPNNIIKNENLGSDTLNMNPRKLLVLFKNNQSYQLVSSNSSLPTEGDVDTPCLEDPLAEGDPLTIKNGVLTIGFHYWLSCGSWYVTNYIYTFRHQNQGFKLIGYDSNDFHRASGDTTAQSINFQTGKIKNTRGGNEFADTQQAEKVTWTKLKNKYSLKLEQINFREPDEFE